MAQGSDDGDLVGNVGRTLAEVWPHYWRVREMSWERIHSDVYDYGDGRETPLAIVLLDYGVELLVVCRRALLDAADDLRVLAATEFLTGVAEEYYMFFGICAVSNTGEPMFNTSRGWAFSRERAESLVLTTGIADWCASLGAPLQDANGQPLGLGSDGVPAPTFLTPGVAGLLSRLRPDLPPLQSGQLDGGYTAVAERLPAAIALHEEISHAVASRIRVPTERRRELRQTSFEWLLAVAHGRSQLVRAVQTDPDGDFTSDTAAVNILRLIAQDIVLVTKNPPERYGELGLLSDHDREMIIEETHINPWIERHAPPPEQPP